MPFVLRTLAGAGLLRPGRPDRMVNQLRTLQTWGYTLAGELRAAAARYPDRTCIIDDRRTITYARLVRRTDRVARALHELVDVQQGDRVGVMCRNHGGLVELMIAITTLGADPVLMNTGLSGPQLVTVAQQQRLRLLCHDA